MFELTAYYEVNTLIQRVDRRKSRQMTMSGGVKNQNQYPDRGKVLEILLSAKSDLPRNEPEIASNISQQLQHMGLDTWGISLIRRVRDACAILQPKIVLETGAQIGHKSAWLFDLFTTEGHNPEKYVMVEMGGKFGVILARLRTRYDAEDWADIKIGDINALCSDAKAWKMANTTNLSSSESPIPQEIDFILVDEKAENLAITVRNLLAHLSKSGVLLLREPDVPVGETDGTDPIFEEQVKGFNDWIELIKEISQTHIIRMNPIFGGTLVGIMKRLQPLQ